MASRCLIIAPWRGGVSTTIIERETEALLGRRIVRVDLDAGSQVRNSLAGLAGKMQRHTEHEEGISMIRFDLEGALETLDCPWHLATHSVDAPESTKSASIVRFNRLQPFEKTPGLGGLLLRQVYLAENTKCYDQHLVGNIRITEDFHNFFQRLYGAL